MQILHEHCIHKHFHTHYFSTYMHLKEICKFVTITCCRKNDQLFLHMNFIAPEHDLFTVPVCGSSLYPIKNPKSPLCITPTLNSHTLTFFGLYVSLSVRLRLFSTNSVCTFLPRRWMRSFGFMKRMLQYACNIFVKGKISKLVLQCWKSETKERLCVYCVWTNETSASSQFAQLFSLAKTLQRSGT